MFRPEIVKVGIDMESTNPCFPKNQLKSLTAKELFNEMSEKTVVGNIKKRFWSDFWLRNMITYIFNK